MFGHGHEKPPDDPLAFLCRRIIDWEARVRDLPVTSRLSRDAIRTHLAEFDFSRPRHLSELVEEVANLLEAGNLHATHPRYFGLFNPSVRLSGVVGDALAGLYNPQLGAWWHSPAASAIEQLTLDYLRRLIGFEAPDAVATFTTGGSEANLTGVLAALAHAFPRYIEDGLVTLGHRPVFYASDQAHDSFVKSARSAGLGELALRRIRSDDSQRLDVRELERAIATDRAEGFSPFLVIATIGTTATGAIDPARELAELCRQEGLWLHADSAWGGIAVLSDALRPHVTGLELADSITWDAHKTLPVPMGAGMFFCRSRRSTEAAFSVHTGYVPDAEPGTNDPYQQTMQWSRRFTGLKVFLTLAELGAAGVAALVEHQAEMAQLLREILVASGWRVTNNSPLPLVCFTRDGLSAAKTGALARFVAADGIVWLSEVRLPNGQNWLRACITNHETKSEDVRLLVDTVTQAWEALR